MFIFIIPMSKWPALVKYSLQSSFEQKKMESHIDSITYRSIYGSTVLHFSVIGGNVATMQYLIDRGCRPNIANADGETALHWACKESSLEVVTLLLANGADYNVQDDFGNTPIHWAVEYDRGDIVHALVTTGASLKVKNMKNQTPLVVARVNNAKQCKNVIKSLSPRKKTRLIENAVLLC